MSMEFITRYGQRFLRAYYRAWLRAPGGIAIVAVDDHGEVVGGLLGEVDPAAHVRWMLRRRGVLFAALITMHALAHPILAKDVVVTRARRYLRGLARSLIPTKIGQLAPSGEPRSESSAVITHLMVRDDVQGLGVGRGLVEEAVSQAKAAGRDLMLVTLPGLPAQHFYERLGWVADGEMTSRSGEVFVRYRSPRDPSTH